MAARKHQLLKHTYSLLTRDMEVPTSSSTTTITALADDFEESELVWGSSSDYSDNDVCKRQTQQPILNSSRVSRNISGGVNRMAAASSLPVNIPDWSKIPREECRSGSRHGVGEERILEHHVEEEEDGTGGEVIPPHELVWRRRAVASSSVQEGIGRTLKGRDLSRLRNAIWEKMGFQD